MSALLSELRELDCLMTQAFLDMQGRMDWLLVDDLFRLRTRGRHVLNDVEQFCPPENEDIQVFIEVKRSLRTSIMAINIAVETEIERRLHEAQGSFDTCTH